MIVVEGPDGAGKTTLIRELRQWFKYPIAPRVVSKGAEAMVDLQVWTRDNTAKGFHAEIYDRHRLISESIYGPTLRDHFEPGFDSVEWLADMNVRFYRVCNPIIIYCLPPWEIVQENVLKEDGDFQPDHVRVNIRSIYALYASRAAVDIANHERTFIYDYTRTERWPQLLRLIHSILDEELIA